MQSLKLIPFAMSSLFLTRFVDFELSVKLVGTPSCVPLFVTSVPVSCQLQDIFDQTRSYFYRSETQTHASTHISDQILLYYKLHLVMKLDKTQHYSRCPVITLQLGTTRDILTMDNTNNSNYKYISRIKVSWDQTAHSS